MSWGSRSRWPTASWFDWVAARTKIKLDLNSIAFSSARKVCLGSSPRRSEEHTSELQSQSNLVCRLLLGKKKIRSVQDTSEHQSQSHLVDRVLLDRTEIFHRASDAGE